LIWGFERKGGSEEKEEIKKALVARLIQTKEEEEPSTDFITNLLSIMIQLQYLSIAYAKVYM